ncbi:hypothetical protein BST92_03555 [Nonlabens arenilitoris]|uniref:Uncharacterized protein n=1 Tax=Nonlabens arenilitoris TaxID=1217969 RepID=A0A2S7U8X4_9FLAO|nr:DUF6029 family protein [Nonlabens arenilitoris]PQJ31057.1 hypothetical protein BST92_03555 [Nonlabens arenilitoris]
MKKILIALVALTTMQITIAQDNRGTFSGGFESNSQWYQDDEGLGTMAPQDQLRSNNYFTLRYSYDKFTAGIQYELFAPNPLLGYFEGFEGNAIGTYYLNFKHKGLDITGGHFYDQFGSGLIYRSWEDRQLGIDNSIRGVRVKYDFTDYLNATAFTGNQRVGFEISDGTVTGVNTELDLSTALDLETGVQIGASYVNRFQSSGSPDLNFPADIGAYSVRADLTFEKFFIGTEYVYKEPDAFVLNNVVSNFNYQDGRALLVNTGYATKGLGINATIRAIENMGFYSDREQTGNPFLLNTINYVPGYTKQQDYAVSNIYVYAPQALVSPIEGKAGEIGGQVDVYYTSKKGSLLGGKYGTKFEFNYANWSGLDATFDLTNNTYDASLLSRGEKYFEEYSIAVKKRFSSNFSTIFTAVHTEYNAAIIEGPTSDFFLNGDAFIIDALYKLDGGRSVRMDLQHLSADADRGNWAAATAEYAFSPYLSMYVTDLYNYDETDIHYYSVGGSYTKGRTRVAMNYGRQRGGLVCVGGVCRFVPENTGLTLNISTNF